MSEFKFKLPESHYREDGTIRDYRRKVSEFGITIGFETETHYLPPNKVRVQWYDYDGNEIDEKDNGHVRSYMFQVFAEGIDPTLVESVEFPNLDYSTNVDYLVKIVVKLLED